MDKQKGWTDRSVRNDHSNSIYGYMNTNVKVKGRNYSILLSQIDRNNDLLEKEKCGVFCFLKIPEG